MLGLLAVVAGLVDWLVAADRLAGTRDAVLAEAAVGKFDFGTGGLLEVLAAVVVRVLGTAEIGESVI